MKKITIFLVSIIAVFTLSSCDNTQETTGVITDISGEKLDDQNLEVEDIHDVIASVNAFKETMELQIDYYFLEYDTFFDIEEQNELALNSTVLDPSSLNQISDYVADLIDAKTKLNQQINLLDYYYSVYLDYVEGETTEYPLYTFTGYVNDDYLYSRVEINNETSTQHTETKVKFHDDYFILESIDTGIYSGIKYAEYFVLDSRLGYTHVSIIEENNELDFEFDQHDFIEKTREQIDVNMYEGTVTSTEVYVKDFTNNRSFFYESSDGEFFKKAVEKFDDEGRIMLEFYETNDQEFSVIEYSLLFLDGWNKLENNGIYFNDTLVKSDAYFNFPSLKKQISQGLMVQSIGFTPYEQINFETVYDTTLTFNGDYTADDLNNDIALLNTTMLTYPNESTLQLFGETFKTQTRFKNYIISLLPTEYQTIYNDLD